MSVAEWVAAVYMAVVAVGVVASVWATATLARYEQEEQEKTSDDRSRSS